MQNVKLHLSIRKLSAVLIIFSCWVLLFHFKVSISGWFIFDALSLSPGTKFSQFLYFFVVTSLKIFLLLVMLVFLIALIRSWLPTDKIRNRLSSMPMLHGNALAGCLGVLTPYCSCSAIPMFISFLETGIPLGITFSFLIAAPLVNEVILVILAGLFGFKITMLYLFAGLMIAILSGYIIDRLKLEKDLPLWLLTFRTQKPSQAPAENLDSRISDALKSVGEILSRTWIYVLAGIAFGAAIHGYVPENFLEKIAGQNDWYTLPLIVLTGVPLYACPASAAPVAFALVGKGVPLGTALAFVMAVAGLSLPEFVMLRRVLSIRLILIFAGIVFLGIIIVGYLFNWLL